jgi:hypothetical protein
VQSQIFKGLIVLAIVANVELRAAICESMLRLQLPDTTITKAESVAAGEFALPATASSSLDPAPFKKLPAFCRVEGSIHPASDSNIEFEVQDQVIVLSATDLQNRFVQLNVLSRSVRAV